jgi:glycosyltransferase involved in cell wall biosynthesis
LRILFLVNGTEDSAAAERVRLFLEEWRRAGFNVDATVSYRPRPKWKGIARFVSAGLRLRPEVVYVVDTAYAGVLAAFVLRMLIGVRVITDTGDAAYELACSTGNYSAWQLCLIRMIEHLALHWADGVVVRGSFHRDLLRREEVRRVEFIPDGAQPVDIGPEERRKTEVILAQIGFGDSLVVGMVGSMTWSKRHQMCYGWDIVEAMAHLSDTKVRALLVGDGDGRARLEDRARTLGVLDRIQFVGRVESVELLPYLLAMDVCISTQSNDTPGWVRTTGKLPLYLAAGRYVVATDVGEAHHVLPDVGCLLPYAGVRDDEHPARLAAHLRDLAANRRLLEKAKAGPEVFAREFDYRVLAKKAWSFCHEVLGRKPPP